MFSLLLCRSLRNSAIVCVAIGLFLGLLSGCRNDKSPDARFDDPSHRRPNNSRKLSVVFVDGVAVPVESARIAMRQMRDKNGTPQSMPGMPPGGMQHPGMQPPGMPEPGKPSAKWSVPSSWTSVTPSSRMRLAEYDVPAVSKGGTTAEMAVFFFGRAGEAMADETLRLWASSFNEEAIKNAKRATRKGAHTVHLIEVTGTYRASAKMNPSAAPSAPMDGWTLLGAIVRSAAGPYFFKLVGPADTVLAAKADFYRLLDTLTFDSEATAVSASASSSVGALRVPSAQPVASPATPNL
ncbi:MAG: hypothetical protein CSA75_01175 [Sorangium cellulosum]|nr:MAG: hypothetical protein CSA75_01175 [Sorangium cellulosum]